MKSLWFKILGVGLGFLLVVACQRHWGEFVAWQWPYSLEELQAAPESLQVGNNLLLLTGMVGRDAMPTIGEPEVKGNLLVSWELTFQNPLQTYDVNINAHYLWVICGNKVFGKEISQNIGETTLKGICECDEPARLVVEVSIDSAKRLLKSAPLQVECYY